MIPIPAEMWKLMKAFLDELRAEKKRGRIVLQFDENGELEDWELAKRPGRGGRTR